MNYNLLRVDWLRIVNWYEARCAHSSLCVVLMLCVCGTKVLHIVEMKWNELTGMQCAKSEQHHIKH